MAQISLYIDDAVAARLNAAAKSRNYSVSKYVAELIIKKMSEEYSEEIRKKQLLEQLCGAIDDPTFAVPPDIAWDSEIERRFDLI